MMRRIRFAAIDVALVLTLAASVSCVKAPPTLTPAAATAFRNQQVQNALDEIRNIVKDGNAATPPVFSTATARAVITWHESAITIVHSLGSGWQTTVSTSLDELLKDVTPAERTTLTPYVTLAKTVIAQVAP